MNSPPAIAIIRDDQQELTEPGPVLFERGSGSLNVELIDTDVADTLQVRVFVDYTIDTPTPPRSTCTAAPAGAARRTVTCDLGALCLPADVEQTRNMFVIVFDRIPEERGDPPFQAMPEGGLSTSRFYFLKCQEPTT